MRCEGEVCGCHESEHLDRVFGKLARSVGYLLYIRL
jgi:hypothetical protein